MRQEDIEIVSEMLIERNPKMAREQLKLNLQGLIQKMEDGRMVRALVATIDHQVVGYCRLSHSDEISDERKTFESPRGWYGLGILVRQDYRRQGVARFMHHHRLQELKALGAEELYSVCDQENQTSMRMHENLGFELVKTGPGFLYFSFSNSSGCLFRLTI